MRGQWLLSGSRLCICGLVTLLLASVTTLPVKAGGAGQRTKAAVTSPKTSRSVVDGIYTERQAKRGHDTYARYCEACHQADLRGLDCSPSLVDEAFAQAWKGQSVGDLFQRVQSTMPEGAAASLSAQEYADVVSYVLSANKFPIGEVELPADPTQLMPIAIEGHAK